MPTVSLSRIEQDRADPMVARLRRRRELLAHQAQAQQSALEASGRDGAGLAKTRRAVVEHIARLRLMDFDDASAMAEDLGIAEQTIIAIEMREREKTVHRFEYDPLGYGR